VARRKYGTHSPAVSNAGHSERGANPTPDESFQRPIEPLSEQSPQQTTPQPQATPPAQPVSGLSQQLHDLRQQQQSDQLDAYLSHYFQGALPTERQWLRDRVHDRPHYFANPMLVHEAGRLALQDGVPRESPQFVATIGKKLDDYFAAMQAQAAPAPSPPPMPPPMPAHTHIDVEQSEHDHEPEGASVAVSAPVSRGAEHYSADYEPSEGSRVHLSTAEREHARASGVSDEVYAREKMRMMKLKKARVLKDE
jgi:hypothetical protein